MSAWKVILEVASLEETGLEDAGLEAAGIEGAGLEGKMLNEIARHLVNGDGAKRG